MKCEKCEKDNDGSYGSGRFCSAKCARSFSTVKDIKKTKLIKCVSCNNIICVDKRASSKQCKCDECRKYIPGRKPKKVTSKKHCIVCGRECGKNSKHYCSIKCNKQDKYDIYITNWKKNTVDGSKNKYRDALSGHIRKYITEKYKNMCSICGWNEINLFTKKVPLQIDHIDGNHLNNSEENLRLVCPNCHSLTETYGGANRGNGRKFRYKRESYHNGNEADC